MAQNKISLTNFPGKISIGFHEGVCNLNCPKCLVHGKRDKDISIIKGTMKPANICQLLDELRDLDIMVEPSVYTEPLAQKDFLYAVKEVKARGLKVAINTNGILLTEKLTQTLIELDIDCIFVSIDATSENVLMQVRGTDKLKEIHHAVFALLKTRGDHAHPRIGVSFTVEEENRFQQEAFWKYWIQYVDAVRVNELFVLTGENKTFLKANHRKPCRLLYDSMLIHHNGDVALCCLDAFGATKVGNVFEQGVQGVWLGETFQKMRYFHETGQFSQIPFCQHCQDWMRYELKEEETIDNILIRRSPLLTYYNRLDRLENWRLRYR